MSTSAAEYVCRLGMSLRLPLLFAIAGGVVLAACRTEVFSQALRSAVTGLAEPADLAFSW